MSSFCLESSGSTDPRGRLLPQQLAATSEEPSGRAEQLQHLMAFFKLHVESPKAAATRFSRPTPSLPS